MLEATFELFVPLVMAAIIDQGIGSSNVSYVLRMGGVMILLGVIGLVCSITAQYFSAKAAVGVSTKLKHALLPISRDCPTRRSTRWGRPP